MCSCKSLGQKIQISRISTSQETKKNQILSVGIACIVSLQCFCSSDEDVSHKSHTFGLFCLCLFSFFLDRVVSVFQPLGDLLCYPKSFTASPSSFSESNNYPVEATQCMQSTAAPTGLFSVLACFIYKKERKKKSAVLISNKKASLKK